MTSTPCHIVHGPVMRVTDFEGHVTHVFCPHLDAARRACRLKQQAADEGPLSRLLERISDDTLDSRDTRCELW